MDNFYAKMQEYLQMDTEISFEEFSEYYLQIINYLKNSYEDMQNEDLFKMKFILSILASNSMARSKRKGTDSKKYKKMADKSDFWSKAINYRLLNTGLSQDEIDQQLAKLG